MNDWESKCIFKTDFEGKDFRVRDDESQGHRMATGEKGPLNQQNVTVLLWEFPKTSGGDHSAAVLLC